MTKLKEFLKKHNDLEFVLKYINNDMKKFRSSLNNQSGGGGGCSYGNSSKNTKKTKKIKKKIN